MCLRAPPAESRWDWPHRRSRGASGVRGFPGARTWLSHGRRNIKIGPHLPKAGGTGPAGEAEEPAGTGVTPVQGQSFALAAALRNCGLVFAMIQFKKGVYNLRKRL